MQEPIIRHSYVKINESIVHVTQYGFHENILKHPSSQSINSSSPSPRKRANNSSYSTITSQSTNSTFNKTNSSCDKANSTSSSNLSNKENVDNLTSSSIDSSSGISNNTFMYDESSSNSYSTSSINAKKLIIFVPGNPGLLGLYHDFLLSLFRTISGSSTSPSKSKDDYPLILAIAHNNFDHPDHVQYQAEERIFVHENDLNFVERAIAETHLNEPHHIELQVLNKLIILKRMLKVNIDSCKVIFIGHSIGGYVILRLLQDKIIASSHEGTVLIHPALENLALTYKGSRFNLFFNYRLDVIGQSIAFILDNILTKWAKLALVRLFCSEDFVRNSSSMALESITQMICQRTYKALVQMAKSELSLIKNINSDALIKPHCSKLKLIYAINDGWVNTDNRKILRELYPDLYMEEQSRLHAFVLDPQTVMDYAIKVGMFVQDFLDNNIE